MQVVLFHVLLVFCVLSFTNAYGTTSHGQIPLSDGYISTVPMERPSHEEFGSFQTLKSVPLPLEYLPKSSFVKVLGYLSLPQNRIEGEQPTEAQLTSSEEDFVQRAKSKYLEDIFADAEAPEDMRYVGFAPPRTEEQEHNDEVVFSAGSHCYRVHVKNDHSETFKKKLGLFLNFRPSGYNEENSWYFSYCIGEDYESDNSVLYYFHGVGGTPRGWVNFEPYSEVREIWRGRGKLPKWVSVSVGRVGLVFIHEWEQRFIDVIAPFIEKDLGFSKKNLPRKRLGVGISMGAANLTHFILNRPNFFSKGFLICPAISTLDPKATDADIEEFVKRTGGVAWVLKLMLPLLPSEFRDPSYYVKIDPLLSGQKLLNSKTAPLYIQTSTEDEFGFEEGGKAFALLARTKGVKIGFNELVGSHCMLEPTKLVDFFLK